MKKPRGTIVVDGERINIADLPVDADGAPLLNGKPLVRRGAKKNRASGNKRSSGKGKKKRKKGLGDILPIIGLLISLLVLLSPTIADLYKQWKYAGIISEGDSTFNYDTPEYEEMWQQAVWYNEQLGGTLPADVDPTAIWPYERQLNTNESGMMCWVEAPAISLKVPVYKGDATLENMDTALMAGAAHVATTSLPVGGAPSKCVLSGHSGMRGQVMFDNIGQLEEGDYITVHTLGRELYYLVTYQEVVLPSELDKLMIDGQDDELCLLTCTPYGVNTHRRIVHASRTDVPPPETNAAQQVVNYAKGRALRPLLIFLAIGIIIVIIFFIAGIIRRRKKRKEQEEEDAEQARQEAPIAEQGAAPADEQQPPAPLPITPLPPSEPPKQEEEPTPHRRSPFQQDWQEADYDELHRRVETRAPATPRIPEASDNPYGRLWGQYDR